VAAFPQARVDMMTYAVLEDVFQGVAEEVMKAATRAYVRQHAFWPTAAELRPYVEWAEREAVQQLSPAEAHELRMALVRSQIRYSDEEMLAWEVARGTMVVDEVRDASYGERADGCRVEEKGPQGTAQYPYDPSGGVTVV
jgi:hypothetical protein